MPRTHAPYRDDFRREIVALMRDGATVAAIVAAHGLAPQTVRNWKRAAELETSPWNKEAKRRAAMGLPACDPAHVMRLTAHIRGNAVVDGYAAAMRGEVMLPPKGIGPFREAWIEGWREGLVYRRLEETL